MNKVGQALNGKKTIIGAVLTAATIIYAAATGQSAEAAAQSGPLAEIIKIIGVIAGGGFLSVGLGHKIAKDRSGKNE